MPLLVAIDGPAGAGKSTVANRVGYALGIPYIDTGAMYRSIALLALEQDLAFTDDALAGTVSSLGLRFYPSDEGQRVSLGTRDVTDAIRSPEVGRVVSKVAKLPGVREAFGHVQQGLAQSESAGVVMDGRDIGTHVLPDADVKIYLTATLEARSRRRHAELVAKGYAGTFEELMRTLHERDEEDGRRQVAPMRPARDAVVLDSTVLSVDEVVAMVVALCQTRHGQAGGAKATATASARVSNHV